jgi:hypothetical protein
MTHIQSNVAKGIDSIPYPPQAGIVVAKRYSMAVTAAMLVLNNILEIAPLPNGLVPVDVTLVTDDLDTGTALVLDVGIMSGVFGSNDQARTCGNEIIAGSNIGQTGGSVRASKKEAFRIGAANTHRSIGVKIATAPTTPAAGVVDLIVYYVAG